MNPEERQRLTFLFRVLLITCFVLLNGLLFTAVAFRSQIDKLDARVHALESK